MVCLIAMGHEVDIGAFLGRETDQGAPFVLIEGVGLGARGLHLLFAVALDRLSKDRTVTPRYSSRRFFAPAQGTTRARKGTSAEPSRCQSRIQ